jgi:hypothetical protein
MNIYLTLLKKGALFVVKGAFFLIKFQSCGGKKMVYEIKCSWCQKPMGTKEGEETEFAVAMKKKGLSVVSHSICPECREVVAIEHGLNNKGGENNG